MGFFARLFGAVPKEERDGIRLADAEPWCVSPTKDVGRFVRALPTLVPAGSIVYFEDTGEAHVRQYLESIAIAPQTRVAVGTIWPRPDCHHVPLTAGTMEALADFLDRNPAGFVCAHCHVYRGDTVLLQWHDAFGDPMYVSRTIDRESVERFAETLGCSVSDGW